MHRLKRPLCWLKGHQFFWCHDGYQDPLPCSRCGKDIRYEH